MKKSVYILLAIFLAACSAPTPAPQDMQRRAGWGVDAITTDRPDELKRVLGKQTLRRFLG